MAFSMLGLIVVLPVFLHWAAGWVIGEFFAMIVAVLGVIGGVWASVMIGPALGVEPDSGVILVMLGIVMFICALLLIFDETLPLKYAHFDD